MVHHGEGLRRLLAAKRVLPERRDALIAALGRDHVDAELERADRAMLDYAEKLTRTPGAIREDDVEALRAAGFDDLAIHDICAITSYYAFVNRIADGLGVDLEPGRGGEPEGDRGGEPEDESAGEPDADGGLGRNPGHGPEDDLSDDDPGR
ncbi:MAG: carboxymuconolactone decarboxylase family protein [Gemmatimonadota bacterium]